ncbi:MULTISPECIES: gliding motility lipoprotein GldH [unclassified Prevotella]|uniref:gliding motility lipoprotein GldH n=1 Tax=unclassified Prevotella TaxID=2638335 RepID=UPI000A844F52|nr:MULTISPECIES: gliding motility lipoprotein GldH [unclassified Prevotella]
MMILTLAITGMLTAACNRSVIYNHYEHVDNDGWERNDTMHFYIPPVKQAGNYQQQVMLRTNNSLPFLGISIIVEQDIYPMGRKLRERIDCPLVEKNGHVLGNGISCYQYTFDVGNIELNEGDSLHVYVMHHMKLETMPGISDVGILISQ